MTLIWWSSILSIWPDLFRDGTELHLQRWYCLEGLYPFIDKSQDLTLIWSLPHHFFSIFLILTKVTDMPLSVHLFHPVSLNFVNSPVPCSACLLKEMTWRNSAPVLSYSKLWLVFMCLGSLIFPTPNHQSPFHLIKLQSNEPTATYLCPSPFSSDDLQNNNYHELSA